MRTLSALVIALAVAYASYGISGRVIGWYYYPQKHVVVRYHGKVINDYWTTNNYYVTTIDAWVTTSNGMTLRSMYQTNYFK